MSPPALCERRLTKHNKTYALIPFLIALFASMTACTVAKYNLTLRETTERHDVVPSSYGGPVYFIIPDYAKTQRCGRWGTVPCRNARADRLGTGVKNGIQGIPFRLIDSLTIPPD